MNKLKNISDLPNLTSLFCNNNELNYIRRLDSLVILQCCGNPISRIPYFNNLKELLCDYNTVKEINRQYKYKLVNSTVNKNNELQMLFG
jgi:Leucine-rich repeat (LRR) protein